MPGKRGLESKHWVWQGTPKHLDYYFGEGSYFFLPSADSTMLGFYWYWYSSSQPSQHCLKKKKVCVYCRKIILLFKVISQIPWISVCLPFICQIPAFSIMLPPWGEECFVRKEGIFGAVLFPASEISLLRGLGLDWDGSLTWLIGPCIRPGGIFTRFSFLSPGTLETWEQPDHWG